MWLICYRSENLQPSIEDFIIWFYITLPSFDKRRIPILDVLNEHCIDENIIAQSTSFSEIK